MQKAVGPCIVPGCDKVKYGRDLCKMHYNRIWRYGRLHNVNAPSGAGWITHDGYRRVCINNKIWFEHVYLAAKALGRTLPPEAVVHHMNGDKLDNHTPLNVVICPNQAYHKLLHTRALEMEKYGKPITTFTGRLREQGVLTKWKVQRSKGESNE